MARKLKRRPPAQCALPGRKVKGSTNRELADRILFLANSGGLISKARFSRQDRDAILCGLEDDEVDYQFLTLFTDMLKEAKNYEAMVWALGVATGKDAKVINRLATEFIQNFEATA